MNTAARTRIEYDVHMQLTPAKFKLALAALSAALGFAIQCGLIPVDFAPVAAVVSTFLAGIVNPPAPKPPVAP